MDEKVTVEENNDSVKSCPKCGADALIISFDEMHYVRCRWVACNTRTNWKSSRETVIDKWNRGNK